MAEDSLPAGAYEAADEAFSAFRVTGQPFPRDELEAALLAAAPFMRAAERERICALADRTEAACTGPDGTSCWFSALIGEPPRDLEAVGAGPLLDPDCRDGRHASCIGDPCECPEPEIHSVRHKRERGTDEKGTRQ
jgi:hypothetical protein